MCRSTGRLFAVPRFITLRGLLLGLWKKDEHFIRAGNEQIEKGRIENEKWRKTLVELYEKYGVSEEKE